jgi:hypothetical protein
MPALEEFVKLFGSSNVVVEAAFMRDLDAPLTADGAPRFDDHSFAQRSEAEKNIVRSAFPDGSELRIYRDIVALLPRSGDNVAPAGTRFDVRVLADRLPEDNVNSD